MFNTNLPGTILTGSYNWGLVFLSYIVAAFVSYSALNLAIRIRESQGSNRKIWTTVCAFTMAAGIWTMHFIGMLAFQLSIPVSYDIGITLLSLVIAIVAAGLAFHLASKLPFSLIRILISGLIMGIGIAAMHYTGMMAMELGGGEMHYTSNLFVLSVIIAIVASTIALWIVMKLASEKTFFKDQLLKISSALVLGGAICGMHYTGMAATVFESQTTTLPEIVPENNLLTIIILAFTLVLFGISLASSLSQKQALFNERQNFFNMLDNLPVCFHLQAPDYSVPFANKMFRERFGEPQQRPCYDLMHQRSSPCEVCSTFRVFDNGENVSSVWESLDKHTYLTVCTPFEDVDGSDLVMEMAVDITNQKKVERELILAKEEAERASNAKSQFLSQMSHELRTPLNAILGFSQLIKLNPGSERTMESKESAQHIYQAGQHLLNLVNDALDLSSIESGKLPLSIESFPLSYQVNELLELMGPLAKQYEVQLVNQINDQKNVWVSADKTRFKQALLNLLTNGIKYNHPGGTVSLRAQSPTDGKVRISVADNGRGIPKDHLDRIFEPFHRIKLDDATVLGAGIGLTITRQLVERMDGSISVESTPGEGSCFSIDLPRGDPTESDSIA